MPGLSFACSLQKDEGINKNRIEQSLNSILHFNNYQKKQLLSTSKYVLAFTGYNEYPYTIFNSKKLYIFLEGRVYGKEAPLVEQELNHIGELIFSNNNLPTSEISNWLHTTDGEFIVFLLNKEDGQICIVNDALGHLPLYYMVYKSQVIVSRELGFIDNLVDNLVLNKMAIAQFLLFSYTLDNKTLYTDVFKLLPSSLIKIDLKTLDVDINNFYTFNFESRKYNNRSVKENVKNLSSILCKVSKSQIKNVNKNILSLSGGLDSRVILSVLEKCSIPYSGMTFLNRSREAIADTEISKDLSKLFNIDWELIHLTSPEGKDYLKLLEMKRGMNFLPMAFILAFLNTIKMKYKSDIFYVTGDTGLSLRYFYPETKISNIKQLLNYILSNHGKFKVNDIAKLLQVDKNEILNELKNYLNSFPETDLNEKYVHFIVYGRTINWHYEGMDRNRYYFWMLAPLESILFFNYIMNCKEKQKKNQHYYREIILRLCSKMLEISDANTGKTLKENTFHVRDFIIRNLRKQFDKYPNLKRTVKENLVFLKPYSIHPVFVNCIKEQIACCKPILNYFSESSISKLIQTCEGKNNRKFNKEQIEILFSITLLIEKLYGTKPILEKYLHSKFT